MLNQRENIVIEIKISSSDILIKQENTFWSCLLHSQHARKYWYHPPFKLNVEEGKWGDFIHKMILRCERVRQSGIGVIRINNSFQFKCKLPISLSLICVCFSRLHLHKEFASNSGCFVWHDIAFLKLSNLIFSDVGGLIEKKLCWWSWARILQIF